MQGGVSALPHSSLPPSSTASSVCLRPVPVSFDFRSKVPRAASTVSLLSEPVPSCLQKFTLGQFRRTPRADLSCICRSPRLIAFL